MDAETIERKLKLAESAAASAILNGATVEQVRARMEAGIADGLDLHARRPSARAALPSPAEPAAPEGSALAKWAATVGH